MREKVAEKAQRAHNFLVEKGYSFYMGNSGKELRAMFGYTLGNSGLVIDFSKIGIPSELATENREEYIKKLAEKAEKEKVDLVILAGDLTESEQSTDYLIGPFLNKKKRVLFLPGNHESFSTADFLAELYKPYAKNLHSYSMRSKDKELGIFGVGGANIGIHSLTEKQLFDNLKKSFKDVKDLKKKIMVSHVHPSGTKMEKFTSIFPGSPGVKKAVEKFKPDLLLCSHVHEADGIEEKIGKTKVINVGKKGKIIKV